MEKKGFTLVEMLAVVVIMGLLIIVAIPQIQNLVASKRGTISETTKQMIYDAADSYTNSNADTFQKMYISDTQKSIYCITLKELVDTGMLDEEKLKDYIDYSSSNKTEQNFLNRIVYATTNQYNEFVYTLSESTICSSDALNSPNKDNNLYVENASISSPALHEGMIPVEYKNGSWVKADLTKEWYKYGEKKWANAVTVSPQASDCEKRGNCIDKNGKHTRAYYQRAIPGTKISLDDVTGMYVWIPRYEYQLNGTSFNINFITTSKISPTSGYTIHPAFQWGGKVLNGLWVAKFEASAPINTSCFQTPGISSCNKSHIDLVVVPKRNAWTGISIENAFQVVANMASSPSFGLDSTKVDSHLIKNTEWGAVAYLTNSKYGKNAEIYINNYYKDKKTITGCSSGNTTALVSTTCANSYTDNKAMEGTTTGNITGIYDLSGGASEFVMGVYGTASTGLMWNGTKIDNQYVDYYQTCTTTESSCLGSALFGTWYNDMHTLVNASNKYMIRGGDYSNGTASGLYAYSHSNGSANEKIGFRPVITFK